MAQAAPHRMDEHICCAVRNRISSIEKVLLLNSCAFGQSHCTGCFRQNRPGFRRSRCCEFWLKDAESRRSCCNYHSCRNHSGLFPVNFLFLYDSSSCPRSCVLRRRGLFSLKDSFLMRFLKILRMTLFYSQIK